MGYATATIANAQEYQRILNTKRPVFILFVSEHCPACVKAGPLFDRIARQYPRVRSLVVDCAKTPRHPDVTGTPTLLIYMRGTLMEKLKGFGPEPQQLSVVRRTFKHYSRRKVAKPLASPAALLPPPPSNATLHAPGSRPPRVDDRAGSSPVPPRFGNPR